MHVLSDLTSKTWSVITIITIIGHAMLGTNIVVGALSEVSKFDFLTNLRPIQCRYRT